MNSSNFIHSDLTEQIIKCFYKIYNNLGYGFLEKVYDRSFQIELKKSGLNFIPQPRIKVYYEGHEVGVYIPDILVEELVVIEIKASITITSIHEDQLKNSLKASDKEVGLLFNFGVVPQFKRKVSANEFKKKSNHSHQS